MDDNNIMIDYDYLYKVCIVGPSGTGKSSLLTRFTDQKFTEKHVSTIGVDFKTKTIEVELDMGIIKRVKLQLWDTAGQERFHSIATQYYRGSHCVVFVFSYDDGRSLENLQKFVDEAEPYNVVHCILMGNKCDIERREITEDQVRRFRAENTNMTFITTSAKTGENVNEAFDDLATALANMQAEGRMLRMGEGKDPLRLPSPRENDEVVTRKCCGGTH